MPPVFAPVSPMGTAADIGVGAGQAGVIEKYAPTLAHIYDSISSSLANRGQVHGGGGGGANNYIQVLPSSDGGALTQVESQANREQRALDLGFEYGQDPVSKHLQIQNQGRLAVLKQQQDYAREQDTRANQPAQPVQPPLSWTPKDATDMAKATQILSTVQDQYDGAQIDEGTYQTIGGMAQDKLTALQQKKEAVDKQNSAKVFQAKSETSAQDRALINTDMQHGAATGLRQIPDLITPIYQTDPKTGLRHLVNKEEYQASVKAKENAQEANRKFLESQQKLQEAADKRKQVSEEHEQGMAQRAQDHYLTHFKEAAKTVDDIENEFMKGNGKSQPDGTTANRYRKNPKERAEDIANYLKEMGLPGTLKEHMDSFRSSRGKGPGTAGPHVDDSEPLTKTAKPEVVADLQSHVGTMPRLKNGQPDLVNSTPEQLDQLRSYYAEDHKGIGASAENAAKWVKAIDAAKANQAPMKDFEHTPPQASAFGRGASNIANAVPEVANRIVDGAEVRRQEVNQAADYAVNRLGHPIGISTESIGKGFHRLKEKSDKIIDTGLEGLEAAGEASRYAGNRLANGLDNAGRNTYELFKRWLGK